MSTFGRSVLGSTSNGLQVKADGDNTYWKPGGVTIDWSTVAAVASTPVTLDDGTIIPVGQKYLRYGQFICEITADGTFGPFDDGASDGRETLTRGHCYFLNETVVETGALNLAGLTGQAADHPGALEGGLVWRNRLLMNTSADDLANGPTVAHVLSAFPMLRFVDGIGVPQDVPA